MNPFGELGVDLSPLDLRETAYEILVGACWITGGGRALKNVSIADRSSLMNRTVTGSNSTTSKVKEALGLKSKGKKDRKDFDELGNRNRLVSVRKSEGSVWEVVKVQMRVSEQTDSRVRLGLLRVAGGQLGKRFESIVLPLELLLLLKISDFSSKLEFETWRKRNLKMLEAGLIVHPRIPLDESEIASQHLHQILCSLSEKPYETGKDIDSMQILHNVVSSLSVREFDGSVSDVCHWADGIPLNFHLYQILLEACFDVNDEAYVIDEVAEVLELMKKTWATLGINQMLHNLCFLWLLFHRYNLTGEIENDLLFAAAQMMLEVENDANSIHDSFNLKITHSIMSLILEWAEAKLLQYHTTFCRGNIGLMQCVLSLGVSAAKILAVGTLDDCHQKNEIDVTLRQVDTYIRSSLRCAFSQEKENVISSWQPSKQLLSPLPVLSILSQNICDLAFNEKEIYSPVLKHWHPLATGVAVATLHSCFADELKKYVSIINELNPEAIQVLLAADKLEKDLVKMAVSDSIDSEDGGKAVIQEMAPYEAESVIKNLVKSWIRTRIERLKEWNDRNLQQENWNPQSNRGHYASSAVEVLRSVDETLEAFFLLPISMHPVLLPELMSGLDKCIQSYIIKMQLGCGSRDTFIPTMPELTRCSTGPKFSAFKKKDRSLIGPGRKSPVFIRDEDGSFSLSQFCLRINTLYNIGKELEALEKRTLYSLRTGGYMHDEIIAVEKFGFSLASCREGIQQLSEAAAYKVVFHDLNHVLWDYMYLGDVSSTRIEPFLQELEQALEVISATVHDRILTHVISNLMRACFEGFLLVLLAGGSSRIFLVQDALMIQEDFKLLADLFWSNGDGLPRELIDKSSVSINGILPLFHTYTENLIDQFNRVSLDGNGASGKLRRALPPIPSQWSSTDSNTILRVLCNRNDKIASKFLKKAFDLPKK